MYPVIRKKNAKTALIQNKIQDVEYLTFPGLSAISGIKHLFSTRLGGVSEGIYASMNLSFTRGDREEAVRENFDRIARVMNVGTNRFVFSDQTHTTNIRVVTAKDAGAGLTKDRGFHDIDGLITRERGLVLSTFYADCVPIFLVDRKTKAIGLCHSGWRGSVGKIGRKTVEAMEEHFDTRPEDICAAIAPSICQECYEVSEDVIVQMKKSFQEEQWPILFYKKENGKFQLNLWKACEFALLEAGVRPECIEVTDICTCENPDYLFSHRASHGKRGNLGAFLMIEE